MSGVHRMSGGSKDYLKKESREANGMTINTQISEGQWSHLGFRYPDDLN